MIAGETRHQRLQKTVKKRIRIKAKPENNILEE